MSRRKKHKSSSADEVKLNVTAMLDMAFQLLAFFVLTFKPAPVEGQIELRMPDAAPVVRSQGKDIGSDAKSTDVLKGVQQLTVSLYPDDAGDLGTIAVETTTVVTDGTQKQKLVALYSRLHQQFSNPANPFDRLVLMVGSDMRYDALMQVVDMCSQLKFADGKPLTKLTFVELPMAKKK